MVQVDSDKPLKVISTGPAREQILQGYPLLTMPIGTGICVAFQVTGILVSLVPQS